MAETSPKVRRRDEKPEEVGEVKITFFKNKHFNVGIEGAVAVGQLHRSRRALYNAVSVHQLKRRSERRIVRQKADAAAAKKAAADAKAAEEAAAKEAAKTEKKGE